ncbi:MAG: NrtA/SsuA/CpmA family ABC transporter substrate-binding protein [Alphaproteobacteria bacterium]|nr:NrtA/SsuA/CpmA family ABC transporter substrate-binding protein [Alphaproteobacteria bacterium]
MRRRNVLLGVGGLACLAAARTSRAFAGAAETLRIGEGTVPDYTHFYVADTLDLWSREGIAAESSHFPAGRLALDAMIAGKVDIAASAETPFMFAAANGLPVRTIATIITYQPFDLVAGPGIPSLDALKGRKIGYAQGTNAHFYLDSLLKSRNLAWRDVGAINLQIGDFVPSLISGAIDGFVWSEPLISAALSKGGQFRRLHSEGLYHTYLCVQTTQSMIDKNPDLLARALKTIMAADRVVKDEPAKAQKVLSDTLKLDPGAPATFWKDLTFGVTLDRQNLSRVLASQAQWAADNGLTKPGTKLPDFATVIDDRILQRARAV